MKISRNLTLLIHYIFDSFLPPLLRDSRWFMWLPFKILFRDKSEIFFKFKEQAPFLNAEEFKNIYIETASVHINRETDINKECIKAIDQNLIGRKVLDIACGRGYLTKRLADNFDVTGADIVVGKDIINKLSNVRFKETTLENLPFKNNEFDTVICAHTLEHVQDIKSAIIELKRVTKKRLIVILPRQRPYKYTFDLHLHFFRYEYDLIRLLNPKKESYECKLLGGDWFFIENLK